MIDLIIIIIFFIIYVLYQMIPMIEEIKISIDLILVSAMLFYIGSNIGDISASKVFMILSIVSILLIPLTIVLKYMEKISNKKD